MGFYELGNGCDSCDTIAPINNVNMQSVPSYLSQASMMAPFGTQGSANVSQYVNATTSGYPQSSGMGSMGTGSSGSTMGATTMTTSLVAIDSNVIASYDVGGKLVVQVSSASVA